MVLDDFDRLVGQIYDAALEPGLWRDALSRLAAHTGADGWHLLGWDVERGTDILGLITEGLLTAGALSNYNAYYGTIDPRREISAQFGPGMVMSCHRHFDERFVSDSEFFQDMLLPLGLRYSMGGCLLRSPAVNFQVGLMRAPQRGPFGAEQEQLLLRLMPHFDRALRLMEQGQTLARAAEISAAGLDAKPLAVIAVDRAGRLRYCNRQGERMLKSGEPLRVSSGVLVCARRDQQSRFAAAVGTIAKSRRPANLLLPGNRNRDERYCLTLMPPPVDGTFAQTGVRDGVLCLVAPVGRRRIATTRQLMALFRLSPGEARLARALAAGESLDGYAQDSGVKLATVKSQLRSIFSKTDTDRQAALVGLVLAVPAVREAMDPDTA